MRREGKILTGILGMLVLALLGGLFFVPAMGYGGMMGWWGPGGMMGSGFGAWAFVRMLVPFLFAAGLFVLLVWAVLRLLSPGPGDAGRDAPEESAEEILRRRFARGEIDAEEYEERLRLLEEDPRKEIPG
ncbi:SHOCT domain-containing protein [Rubrobacter naiadicus]|uniref:SHOCT domain-containing protein n=1 Tax=Rubrobacter naiadicus TaxID=1392641 RepID=UPI00235E05FD|nr:SHOCT domain-containing protein [Rubrobacter naiadicus]